MTNSKRYEIRGTKHHPIGSEMVEALHWTEERQRVAGGIIPIYEWMGFNLHIYMGTIQSLNCSKGRKTPPFVFQFESLDGSMMFKKHTVVAHSHWPQTTLFLHSILFLYSLNNLHNYTHPPSPISSINLNSPPSLLNFFY